MPRQRKSVLSGLDADIGQRIFATAPVGMVVSSKAARILRANAAFCRFLGYTEQELCRRTIHQVTHPDDWPLSWRMIRRVWSGTPRAQSFEKRFLHKNGKVVWGFVHAQPVPDRPGQPGFLVSHIVDITARKEAEAARRTSEERFQRLFESMRDAYVRVDLQGRIIEANPAYRKLVGYTSNELQRLTYMDLTPAKWHRFEARIVREQLRPRGHSEVYEKEYRRKDGTIIPVELRTFVVLDAAGQPEAMWAIVRDITVRKKAEEVLRDRTELLTALLNAPTEPILLLNTDFRVVAANNALLKRMGRVSADIVGKPVFDIFPPEVNQSRVPYVRKVLQTGKPLRFEDSRDGRFLDNHIYPVFDASGKVTGVAIYSQNITQRKQAEKALLAAHAELEQKVRDRTAKLSDLAALLNRAEERERRRIAGILHDELQQVITGIRYMLGGLQATDDPNRERRQTLRKIDRTLDKAHQILRSLCVELCPPVLRDAGVDAALKWLTRDMQEKFGLTVTVELDDAVEPVTSDLRAFIFETVRELLFNAVKHAGVKTARVRLARTAEGRLRLEVADRGAGFDPLQSTPSHFGLFSIRERAENLGGLMRICSAPRKGTRVTLELPEA